MAKYGWLFGTTENPEFNNWYDASFIIIDQEAFAYIRLDVSYWQPVTHAFVALEHHIESFTVFFS